MDPDFDIAPLSASLSARAYGFVRRIGAIYAGFLLTVLLLSGLAMLPGAAFTRAHILLENVLHDGLIALTLNALLLAVTALAATLLATAARRRNFEPEVVAANAVPLLGRLLSLLGGRRGQVIVTSLGALAILGISWVFSHLASFVPRSSDSNLAAGFFIFLAFPSLIAERSMHGFAASQLPEAPALRRVLLLTTVLLAVAGGLEIGLHVGMAWLQWPIRILLWLPALVAAEFALRAIGRCFAPAPPEEQFHAVTDSLLLSFLTDGMPAPGALLREHLGLDFARSWAVQFLRAAALPAILATALFCWCLSGLAFIDYGQRGVYERFGAPVAVLKPGLHLLMPWPFGRLRPVEFGTVHTVVAGLGHKLAALETVGAEETMPARMNRLWETINPTEVEYLVASHSNGQQGFQAVSAEVRVLYRTGLSDKDALQSLYGGNDPGLLVQTAAARLTTQYFASHTLDDVLGARRDRLQEDMQSRLQFDLRDKEAGIDIVAVEIEAIHPPSGAADAYHAVQAAEINADASVADETARAEHMLGVAQQEATQRLDSATAGATETLQRAKAGAYTFDADLKSSRGSSESFLMERRFANLVTALSSRRALILDSRVPESQAPIIDMRAWEAARANGTPVPVVSPEITLGTSTEGETPPMTSEQADEEARDAQKAAARK